MQHKKLISVYMSLLLSLFAFMSCDSGVEGDGEIKVNNSIRSMYGGDLDLADAKVEKSFARSEDVFKKGNSRSGIPGTYQAGQFKRFWFQAGSGADNVGVSRDIEGIIYKDPGQNNKFTIYCPAQSNIEDSKTAGSGFTLGNPDARATLKASFSGWYSWLSVKVGGVSQVSGQTVNDFTSDVIYTVSHGGVTNFYTVKVLPTVDGNILKYSDGSRPYAMNPEHSAGYKLSLSVGSAGTDNIVIPTGATVTYVKIDGNYNGQFEQSEILAASSGSPYEVNIDPNLYQESNSGKIYQFRIRVEYNYNQQCIYRDYVKRISVAEHLKDSSGQPLILPAPQQMIDGFFTPFDFYYDTSGNRNLLALSGKKIFKYHSTNGTFEEVGQCNADMDPAFIKVMRDNNSILLGAGAGGYSMADNGVGLYGEISKLTGPSYLVSSFAGDIDYHFSVDVWDYFQMLSGQTHDWVIMNHGDYSYGNAHVILAPWNDWNNTVTKTIVSLPGTPSCGLWTNAAGDIYLGSCQAADPQTGTMGGQVYRVSKSNVLAAYNGSPIVAGTDSEAEPVYDTSLGSQGDTKYTQYAVLGDNMGNIFVTGGIWGAPATTIGGYFETRSGETQGKTEPILISKGGTDFGYVSHAIISFDKRYMGFVSDMGGKKFQVWVIPIAGAPVQ